MPTPIQRSIRLRPNDTDFIQSNSYENGEIYFDSNQNTLVLFDGQKFGGYPLLRADLSNIVGGSGGSGTIDFGDRDLKALRFIGDGSQLTNLPIPEDAPSLQDVENLFNTPATTTSLGTVKIGSGLSITQDGTLSADAFQEVTGFSGLEFLSFVRGVSVDEFSVDIQMGGVTGGRISIVPTEFAVRGYVDSQISSLDLDANGIINSGTANQIGFYAANGNTISATGVNLTWNSITNTLSTSNLFVTGNAEITNNLSVNNNVIIQNNLVVDGSIEGSEFFNEDLGVFELAAGSDFIIKAAGEINVTGSKIVGLGTPTDEDHAVNKAYVDGAASQFTGGVVPNPINITSATVSTSTTTGALTVTGGVGVGGAMYVDGTIFSGGSAVLTSLSGGFNGGTISGTVFINNATASTNTTSGALRVTGGVGVGRSIFTGGDSFFNGIRVGNGADIGSGFAQNVSFGGGTGINTPLGSNISGVNDIAIGFSTLGQHTDGSDNIAIGSEVMANKTFGSQNIGIGTEALKNHAGFGNIAIGHQSGVDLFEGNFNVIIGGNTGLAINELNSHIILSDGNGVVKVQFNDVGALGIGGADYGEDGFILSSQGEEGSLSWVSPDIFKFDGGEVSNPTVFQSESQSTNTNTGAVVVTGGVGIGGGLNVGGDVNAGSIQSTPIGSVTRSTGAFTTLSANANVASTTTGNGTLVVTGGVGISGAVNIGSGLGAGGAVRFTQNSASSSISTGTLVVTGGVGVSGDLNIGGNFSASLEASVGGLSVSGLSTFFPVTEVLESKTGATGTVVHDYSTTAIWWHTSVAANFTANFTNVPITSNRSVTVVLAILQGTTGRIPNAVQINSVTQTINWANNTVPAGIASRVQFFTFNLLRIGTTWRVLGTAQSY